MPHLHTAPGNHDLTASAMIIRTDGPEPRVVLHLHRKLNMLLQFGGHVELNETPWQGVLREVREESGYVAEQLSVLQPPGWLHWQSPTGWQHPLPADFNTHRFKPGEEHFHSDLAYAMVASEPPRQVPDEGESADIHEYTAAQLRALPLLPKGSLHPQTQLTALFFLEHTLRDWEPTPATDWPA